MVNFGGNLPLMEFFRRNNNKKIDYAAERKRLRDLAASRIHEEWEKIPQQHEDRVHAAKIINRMRNIEALEYGRRMPYQIEEPKQTLTQKLAQTTMARDLNLFLNQIRFSMMGKNQIQAQLEEEARIKDVQQWDLDKKEISSRLNLSEMEKDISEAENIADVLISPEAKDYLRSTDYATAVKRGEHRQNLIAANRERIEALARDKQAKEGNLEPEIKFLKNQQNIITQLQSIEDAGLKIARFKQFMNSDDSFGLRFFEDSAKAASHKPHVAEAVYGLQPAEVLARGNQFVHSNQPNHSKFSNTFRYDRSVGIDHFVSFYVSSSDPHKIAVEQLPDFTDLRRKIPSYFDLDEILKDIQSQVQSKLSRLEAMATDA